MIKTVTFWKRLKDLFEPGDIFKNHILKETEHEPHSFAEVKELFIAAKKCSKKIRNELAKDKKVNLKLTNWITTLGDPTITEEEIVNTNKALNWTDLCKGKQRHTKTGGYSMFRRAFVPRFCENVRNMGPLEHRTFSCIIRAFVPQGICSALMQKCTEHRTQWGLLQLLRRQFAKPKHLKGKKKKILWVWGLIFFAFQMLSLALYDHLLRKGLPQIVK